MHFTREIRKLLQREPLDAPAMARVWGAMLDGALDDVETGAVVAGLAVGGETREELAGLYRAVRARMVRWTPPVRAPLVSIAAYGMVPGEALAIGLAGTLLRRFGVPVLIHGVLDSHCGVSSATVLRELGILPCASFAQADEQLAAGHVAFLPAQLVSPALASLIAMRSRLGIETAAHVVAHVLDPTQGSAMRLTLVAGGASERVERLDDEAEGDSVVLRWPAGRTPSNLSIRPRIERMHAGTREVLFEADAQETPTALAPPTDDAPGMAQWIQRATDGSVPVPVPALSLVAACLYAVGSAPDFTQAKAIAALHAGRLAA